MISTFLLIFVLCYIGSYDLDTSEFKESSVLYNIQILFGRSSSFFIGWLVAYYTEKEIKISIFVVLSLLCFIHILYYLLLPHGFSWWWIYTIPVSLFLCKIIDVLSSLNISLCFFKSLGDISLESYITNWGLTLIFPVLLEQMGVYALFNGYIQYFSIIIIGLLLAYAFHKICNLF